MGFSFHLRLAPQPRLAEENYCCYTWVKLTSELCRFTLTRWSSVYMLVTMTTLGSLAPLPWVAYFQVHTLTLTLAHRMIAYYIIRLKFKCQIYPFIH